MAQNQVAVSCPRGVWTQLTNADVTAITFSVLQGDVFIRLTAGTTTPTETTGMVFTKHTGVFNTSLTDISSLTGANRVWAMPVPELTARSSVVHVDHA